MSNVKRVYVEKKPEFAVAAKGLRHEIRHYLGLQDVTNVRVLIRYDAENISEETFEKACNGVFAEPPVDFLYKEEFPKNETVKNHCINPVDSREAAAEKPETLVTVFDEPADVKIFDGFKDMPEAELKELYDSLGLAMTFKDFQHIQTVFHVKNTV